VLVPGCGDSKLSEDMAKHLSAEVVSIDFEEETVKRMNERKAEGVTFEIMDMLALTYSNESFDHSMDKGTLDALCCDDSEETQNKVKKYFGEIERVLKQDGSCLIVTLLQDFVLKAVIDYFGASRLTIEPLQMSFWSKQTKFVPFLVTATMVKSNVSAEEEAKISDDLSEKVKRI
jgi:ubiquinone/menaquinone biosynthesis C-methylase UbiE